MNLRRFTASDPCPVCDGHPKLPHGQGVRCAGFISEDGYVHCTREERAGRLPATDAEPPTFAHIDRDDCRCGLAHHRFLTGQGPTGPAPAPWSHRATQPPRRLTAERWWDIRAADGKVMLRHWRKDYDDGGEGLPVAAA